jgi:predicted  nucleic acid-binding Zn-ribbon protein
LIQAQAKIKWTFAEEQVRALRSEVAELKTQKGNLEQQLKQVNPDF